MRKFAILALSCILVAGLFAGCRRNPAGETSMPSTNTTGSAATTTPTTQTTRPTTRPTETTRNTTPEMPTDMPGGTTGTDNEGRVRQTPPRY